jgi:xanthine dehydrogenase accessory factor
MYVVITEQDEPRAVRRTVAFSTAVSEGEITIEGVRGVLCTHIPPEQPGYIPLLVDAAALCAAVWLPDAIVDARMLKQPQSPLQPQPRPWLTGLGPGFTAGVDCDAVVETNRGHDLGRVIWHGQAAANTGVPGDIQGYREERLLRAPADGRLSSSYIIGDPVEAGQAVAAVGEVPLVASISGVLRGLIQPGLSVKRGEKVGDIDPRGVREYCFTVSDKSNAVAGGALEAVLALMTRRSKL